MEQNQTTSDTQETATRLFERTRDQLKVWSTTAIDELQGRASAITERKETLLKQGEDLHKQGEDLLKQGGEAVLARRDAVSVRKDELLKQRDDAARVGRETILGLEATALEGARDLLAKAEELVGPNAAFLARGRSALEDALVTVRSAYAGGLPIEGYDALSVSKITPHLDDLSASDLKTVRAYEAANKNRKTLLRELDARLGPV